MCFVSSVAKTTRQASLTALVTFTHLSELIAIAMLHDYSFTLQNTVG